MLRIVQPVRVLDGGNHHPLLCEMQTNDGPAGLWVVKPPVVTSIASNRGSFGVLSELAAAEACTWVGIQTPAVGLARFPEAFERAWLDDVTADMAIGEREEVRHIFECNRARLAFCCRFLPEALDLKPVLLAKKRWRSTSAHDAVALLVLDGYLRNDDRQEENPNSLWWRGRLAAIDHGDAFASLHRSGMRGEDLAMQTVLHSRSFPRHVAARAAEKYGLDASWNEAIERLEGVSSVMVEALASHWPEELDSDPFSNQRGLRLRLSSFLIHRGRYVRDIAAALRNELRGTR